MIEIVRHVKSILVVIICCVFPHNSGNATGLFLPYQVFSVGSWPEAVAIGDVNNDDKNDVVITTSSLFGSANDYHVHVFLQNDSGRLNNRIKYPAGNGKSVDIGDVNNDGKNDVVVTANESVGVLLQNDSGGLDPMFTYSSNFSRTDKLKVADFNNDKLTDVVTIGGWDNSLAEVFLQNLSATLDPPITYPVLYGGNNDLDVGDVNNDSLTDIIVMSGRLYDNIGVLLQNADGFFDVPIYYDIGGKVNSNGIAVGDVNNDTLHDIVLSYRSMSSKMSLFYAAFCLSSTSFFTCFTGLRYTVPTGVQSRVFLDQRSGCFALAAS